jgi:hypothetical protein
VLLLLVESLLQAREPSSAAFLEAAEEAGDPNPAMFTRSLPLKWLRKITL